MAALALMLGGCSRTAEPARENGVLTDLIKRRDLAAVETALNAGANPNVKDADGDPAMVLATATDQYRIANLLLQKGADIYATDDFGLSPALLADQSRILPESVEGHARAAFVAALRAHGHPWPPPNPKQVMRMKAEGRWPPAPQGAH